MPQHKTTYDWEYKYEGDQPHAVTRIGENTYTYDANGNQTGWTDDKKVTRRQILWDEENRLRAIADNGTTHHYIYDAAGERVIKSTGDGQAIYINGFPMGGSGTVGSYTMYVSPFIVVQNAKYTKHFYIEGQRIASKLGEMGTEQELLQPKVHAGDSLKSPVDWNSKKELSKDIIISGFEALGLSGAVFTAGKSGKLPYGQIKKYYRNTDAVINPVGNTTTSNKTEDLQFYYHPDHLGSSNYITDASGEVYQHQEYFPFGETFVEERNDAEHTTYLFNGKELDEETGLYYYGARYYDARISLWVSVDPKAGKYPTVSPYVYVLNNPNNVIDPDGKDVIFVNGFRSGFSRSRDANFQEKLKNSYWNNVNPSFTSNINKYFNDNKNHFVNASHWNGSTALSRQGEGYQLGIKMVTSGEIKLSAKNNIMTIVMHSQGNAEGVGIAGGIIDEAARQGIDVKVNLVFLSVHQPDDIKMSDDLKKQGIQFTYANDNSSIVDPMGKIPGVEDANSENKNWKKEGLDAHSATVDDKAAFESIKMTDKEKKIYTIKK